MILSLIMTIRMSVDAHRFVPAYQRLISVLEDPPLRAASGSPKNTVGIVLAPVAFLRGRDAQQQCPQEMSPAE